MPGAVLIAWGGFIYWNALHAHHLDPAWVLDYFWPPVGTSSLAGILGAQIVFWKSAGVAGLWAAGLVAGGATLQRWIGSRDRPGVMASARHIVLGSWAGGAIVLGLALTGLVVPPLLALVTAGLVASGPRAALRGGRAVRDAVARLNPSSSAVLLAGLVGIGLLAGTIAPETVNDALRFHLEVPRRLLLTHRLVPQDQYIYAWFPLLQECASTASFWMAGASAVRMESWLTWVLVALVIAEWIRSARGSGRDAGAGAAAWCVLLGVPILAPMAMTDIALALVVTLAVESQFVRRSPVMAGVLWGAALGIKYQAGMFLAGALVAGVMTRRRGTIRLLVAGAVPFLPLAIRAWLSTGSLVAPFFVDWWGAGLQEHLLPLADVRQTWQRTASPLHSATALVHLATHVTTWDALCSPLIVVLTPAALLLGGPAAIRITLLVSLVIWSLVAGYSGRYLLPMFPLILILAAGGLRRRFGDVLRSGAARLALLAVLVFEAAVSFHWAYREVNPNGIITGKESPEAYVRRMVVPRPLFYAAAVRLRGTLNPATRYYLAGMDNGFYLGGLPYIETEDLPSPWSKWSAESADARRLRIAVRQRGLRYLFFHETHREVVGLAFPASGLWTPRSRAVFEAFFRRYPVLRLALHDGSAAISFYEFSPSPVRPQPLPRSLP